MLDCPVVQDLSDLFRRVSLIIMEINWIFILFRQRQDSFQYIRVILRNPMGSFDQSFRGNSAGAEKALQQILTGVGRDPDDPCLFMFRVVKGRSTKDIFQKYSLKYVFCVSHVFQMDHADPAGCVPIEIHSPVRIFFTAHVFSPFLECFFW